MIAFYNNFFFEPLYNSLIFLFKVFPWADAGVIVVILTILVRLILFPLSRKAVLTQVKMNELNPQIEQIKEKYKSQPEEQARRTLALYRETGVNPFSGIFVIIIQIPIIFALYQIFLHFPKVDGTILYSFVSAPANINTTFLGLVEIGEKSLLLAFLAGISTYFQFIVSTKGQKAPKGNSFGDNLAKNMQTQMKFIFPVIMFFIAYTISGVIGLYFLTTNLFSIAQEIFVRRKLTPTP